MLFVCTGNICRSPTAERLAAAYATRCQIADFTASSAGTRALVQHPIHDESARVLQKLGGDPSHFAARRLTPRIASDADLILTMTREHRDRVLEVAPQRLHRTFTLAEAFILATECDAQSVADLSAHRPRLTGHDTSDITDPIGQDPEIFEAVGSQIADLLPPIVELCRRTSGPRAP